jgi:YesN/AraC family two-component response regulator
MYSFYLEDAVTAVDKTLKFNAIEEKQMHDNFVELLDAFNNQDEEKLIYYLKSELRMKEYGNVFGKKNYLRGQKDSLIGYVSILNEAAIRHNFPAENAYYIFNRILAKIETQEVEISFNLWLENITLYYFNEMKRYFATHNLSLAERINIYIQENIKSKLTLKELSDYFGYSERYLNKKFKEKYDITIKQYVLNQKVEVAKKMISTTNFNIRKTGLFRRGKHVK